MFVIPVLCLNIVRPFLMQACNGLYGAQSFSCCYHAKGLEKA